MKNNGSYRSFIFRGALLGLFSLAVAAPGSTRAHEVWIEDTPEGQVYVRFAEYGEKLETSPGALDSLALPYAWKPDAAQKEVLPQADEKSGGNREARDIRAGRVDQLPVQKRADGFLLEGAKATHPIQIETGFTVMGGAGDPEKPARKPYFYARWHPEQAGAGEPALTFDLVPTASPGEIRVYLRGRPLAGVKVTLYPPDAASKDLVSDESGLVRFDAVKPGLYLLVASHQRENVTGFFGGKRFDVISHNCTLAWRKAAPAP